MNEDHTTETQLSPAMQKIIRQVDVYEKRMTFLESVEGRFGPGAVSEQVSHIRLHPDLEWPLICELTGSDVSRSYLCSLGEGELSCRSAFKKTERLKHIGSLPSVGNSSANLPSNSGRGSPSFFGTPIPRIDRERALSRQRIRRRKLSGLERLGTGKDLGRALSETCESCGEHGPSDERVNPSGALTTDI